MEREEALKILAMRSAFKKLKNRQKANHRSIPDLDDRLRRLRQTREVSVGNYDLLRQTVENLENNGVKVYHARDSSEAIKCLIDILGEEKLVVKSKSSVSREIKLVENLEGYGIRVIETDIGDRILQIMGEKPSHPTGPAAHLTVEMISHALSDYFGKEVLTTPQAIIKAVREDVERHLASAKIGISGANAITAEGSIVLLHNEGNIFEVHSRPEHWVVITGIEKVYPSVEEAMNAAKIQSFYATGSVMPSFIEVISGGSRTADIEKRLVRGVAKPREVTLILLDNGRQKLIQGGFGEFLYCIGCGSCVVNCPAHTVHGERFAGGRFALLEALHGNKDVLKYCLSCRRCRKNCPLKIDVPGMISRVREGNEVYNFIRSHLLWIARSVEIETFKLRLLTGF